jgi:CMP-N,N'-diacetyllegionaminic acid synthase
MSTLIVIPARAGSKGLPGKNTKLFNEKPLISHTLEYALEILKEDDIICVTTNDNQVEKIVNQYKKINLLKRPTELASDTSGMSDVLLHALSCYQKKNIYFNKTLLLQPTSLFRFRSDYERCSELLDISTDIVISVSESKANPYFNLFEESENGFLKKCKQANYLRRQDCPKVYEYNGSLYLMKTSSLIKFGLHNMPKIKKFVMPFERSIDIDDQYDWDLATYIYNKNFKNIDFNKH